MIMPPGAGTNGKVIYWGEDLVRNVVAEVDKVIEIYDKEAKRWEWIKKKEEKNKNKDAAKEASQNEATFLKKISCLQDKNYRLHVIYLSAAGGNSLGISGNEWDQDPYLIACNNGVLDLHNNNSLLSGRNYLR